jgi:transcriptional regulator with XRE-family HTH domain
MSPNRPPDRASQHAQQSARDPDAGPEPESLGALLAQLRAERGWSQLRLAEHLCAAAGVSTVSRHEISRWERQERVPGRFWLGWLALVLDAPLDRLSAARPARRKVRATARPTGRATRAAA